MSAQNKKRKLPTLKRKIYFYRIDLGSDDEGNPIKFDANKYLKPISSLPFSDKNGRYISDNDGNDLCCWIDQIQKRSKLRFGQIRRTSLPMIENKGELDPLKLEATAGLVDNAHIVFFENNILGAEFNFFAPRVPRLSQYFYLKSNIGKQAPLIQPLLNQDAMDRLDQLQEIRLLDIKIHPSQINLISQADKSLAAAFKAAAKVGESETIQLLLRPDSNSRKKFLTKFKKPIAEFVSGSEYHGIIDKLHIKGKSTRTNKVIEFDLLKEHLVSQKSIIRIDARYRTLDSTSAYNAIEEAYDELQDQILKASAIKL